ncbi:MAG: 7-cyano-7-deazaguanine synthase QueC, partial [Candidatus Methanomethylicaceae archaeon]
LVISFDMTKIGGSALTDNIDVPVDRNLAEIGRGIPVTYVPARNTIFLAFAVSYAETIGAEDIFIGVSEVDYSGYPDCRREFVDAFEKAANLGTKAGTEGGIRFRIHTPLVKLSKAQTIKKGLELGVDFSLTWSCYLGGQKPCGKCDSCKLRLAGFAQIGMKDPLEYAD